MTMKNEKLVSADTFEEDGRHYMRLVYEYEDEKNNLHRRIYPKVEFPFCSLALTLKPTILVYPKCDPEGIERGVDIPWPMFDIIQNRSPEPRKMTLNEIEKELGYSVIIVEEKCNA